MKLLSCLLLTLGLAFTCTPARAVSAPGSFDVHWNEGAADCDKSPQPPLQIYRYDAATYILRESPCATFEAPFMYLLAGSDKALLIDTGDVADAAKMPLAKTVIALLPKKNGARIPLIVVHTHGHMDHRAGDPQFRAFADVQVVGTDLAHVKRYFGFADWPNGEARIDLGGRIVDVLPTPGHYPSHVSYYDRNTGLFFSGDFLMPARLIIGNTTADLASARRVADFVKDRPVTYVLGGHIEMNAHGELYDLGSHYHPDEHALQLGKQELLNLPAVVARFNGFYTQDGIYMMMNQYRVLAALLAAFVLALSTTIALAWRFLRWRRRRPVPA